MFAEELLCWQLVEPGAKEVLGMLWDAGMQGTPGDVWVTVGAGMRQSFRSALRGSAEAKPSVMP